MDLSSIPQEPMLRTVALVVACVATASAFTAPAAMAPMQLRSSAFCPASSLTPAARPAAAKKAMGPRMDLSSITDNDGSPLDLVKGFAFFGASFFPSLFLAGYFLGGYYPGMVFGVTEEPSWWPTSMQYAHGVNKATLATNVAKVEAKEAEIKAAKDKAAAAKKAAKAAKKAAEAAAKQAAQ
eukprot:CAMPEP_0202817418 /NCGR_PEP_ID=MMETSP1389-20130828/7630_1 /ASSEMBLY_ACC=CAM_ASM_000865 /TAXON_ID=302021 /ORGANISM="Rhodomonas sp., Strain CCMP768" /LENGTH=181 /DNA_ID=CAMNT_0049489633 /DNA_START=18 /DNA_END=563 /DNA_ORIENTATION=-